MSPKIERILIDYFARRFQHFQSQSLQQLTVQKISQPSLVINFPQKVLINRPKRRTELVGIFAARLNAKF